MTRSFFKGLTLRAIICVILTLGFLISCLGYARSVARSGQQERYRELYGSLLMASEYRSLKTEVLENHESVLEVFSAYDESGRLIGYVLDVKNQTTDSVVHTQMSISEDGENLMNIRVVEMSGIGEALTDEQVDILRTQLEGKRIPVSIRKDLPAEVYKQMDYDPLLGLHDGVYYAEAEKPASDGYKDYCEIEVSGGRIIRVEWNAVNELAHTRYDDSISGEYKVSGNIWAEQSYRLCNHLVLVQDPVKLAMKSDGKTEIIDGVTIDISTFVSLVNECIANSRASYTKEQYLRNLSGTEETTGDEPAETTVTPDKTPDSTDVTMETEGQTAAVSEPSEIGVIGGEDGVVSSDSDSILSDSVDGIPLSEIRTYIDGIPEAQDQTAALLSTVNEAYKFMREYLNWVG
ncbi:MAG: hypothetical protein J5636_05090 [Clostridiales bacterium]|nr:hypothetical protein [Clostridiales bacterium]